MTVNDLKTPYSLVFISWLIIIILTVITSNSVVAAIAICLTGILPFIFMALWVSLSDVGVRIRHHFKKWHYAVIFGWILFAYTIYARKWAASLINEIFHVDATSLGITYTLLAALYAPIGFFYQEWFVGGMWSVLIIVSMVVGLLSPFIILVWIASPKVFKLIGCGLAALFVCSIFLGVVANLSLYKNNLIREFAVWADFNSSHLCKNGWAKDAQGVVFLGGDRVLTYMPKNPQGSRFVPQTCDYAMSL